MISAWGADTIFFKFLFLAGIVSIAYRHYTHNYFQQVLLSYITIKQYYNNYCNNSNGKHWLTKGQTENRQLTGTVFYCEFRKRKVTHAQSGQYWNQWRSPNQPLRNQSSLNKTCIYNSTHLHTYQRPFPKRYFWSSWIGCQRPQVGCMETLGSGPTRKYG